MRNWIFQAEAPYEMSGLTPNVVFPTGLLLQGDELLMYYGAADSCTSLATAKLDEVLALLVTDFVYLSSSSSVSIRLCHPFSPSTS